MATHRPHRPATGRTSRPEPSDARSRSVIAVLALGALAGCGSAPSDPGSQALMDEVDTVTWTDEPTTRDSVGAMAAGDSVLWLAIGGDTLLPISLDTATPGQPIEITDGVDQVAALDDRAWFVHEIGTYVDRERVDGVNAVDVDGGGRAETNGWISTGGVPDDLAVWNGALWMLDTSRVLHAFPPVANGDDLPLDLLQRDPGMSFLLEAPAGQIAATPEALWVTHEDGALFRVDAATYRIDRTELSEVVADDRTLRHPEIGRHLAADESAVWLIVEATEDGTADHAPSDTLLVRLDAADPDRTEVVEVPYSPTDIALHDGAAWLCTIGPLVRVDDEDGAVLVYDEGCSTIAVAGGEIWFDGDDGEVHHLDPDELPDSDPPPGTQPGSIGSSDG